MRGRYLLAFVVLPACLEIVPDTGPPQQDRCDPADSDPSVAIAFQTDVLEAILVDACDCHDPSNKTRIGFEIAGLELTSYSTLRAGGANSGDGIVVAGDPCTSILALKVKDGPPFGRRMPFNGPPYLTVAEQQTIHDWIAEGALDN